MATPNRFAPPIRLWFPERHVSVRRGDPAAAPVQDLDPAGAGIVAHAPDREIVVPVTGVVRGEPRQREQQLVRHPTSVKA